jgi:hypothetical protein
MIRESLRFTNRFALNPKKSRHKNSAMIESFCHVSALHWNFRLRSMKTGRYIFYLCPTGSPTTHARNLRHDIR